MRRLVITRHAREEWTRLTGHDAATLDRALPTGRVLRSRRARMRYECLVEIPYARPGGASVYCPVRPDGAIPTVLSAEEAANNHGIGTTGPRVGTAVLPAGFKGGAA